MSSEQRGQVDEGAEGVLLDTAVVEEVASRLGDLARPARLGSADSVADSAAFVEGGVEDSAELSTSLPLRGAEPFGSGGRVLSVLGKSLNVKVIELLAEGSLGLAGLRAAIGAIPESTLRERLGALAELGAVGKRKVNGMPLKVDNVLTAAGRDLPFVVAALQAWLAWAPGGPMTLESDAARAAVKALAAGWSSTAIRALAAGPVWLTELAHLIDGLSYPSLERRFSALRTCGQVEPVAGARPYQRYAATDWLRQSMGLVLAAMRWERCHLTGPPSRRFLLDAEAALLMALPLAFLGEGVSGFCTLVVSKEVSGAEGGAMSGFALHVEIEAGWVVSAIPVPVGSGEAAVVGSLEGWLEALVTGDTVGLEVDSAGRAFGRSMVQAIHRALFYRAGVCVVGSGR